MRRSPHLSQAQKRHLDRYEGFSIPASIAIAAKAVWLSLARTPEQLNDGYLTAHFRGDLKQFEIYRRAGADLGRALESVRNFQERLWQIRL